jgi:hypothetical protein
MIDQQDHYDVIVVPDLVIDPSIVVNHYQYVDIVKVIIIIQNVNGNIVFQDVTDVLIAQWQDATITHHSPWIAQLLHQDIQITIKCSNLNKVITNDQNRKHLHTNQ